MPEWRTVSWTPWELGAETSCLIILSNVSWCNVTNLVGLLTVSLCFLTELHDFEIWHWTNFTSISHCLHLIKMVQVVGQVERVVPLHGNIKSLHLFSSVSTTRNSTINSVLCVQELAIFCLNLVYNIWGVDSWTMTFPINILKNYSHKSTILILTLTFFFA